MIARLHPVAHQGFCRTIGGPVQFGIGQHPLPPPYGRIILKGWQYFLETLHKIHIAGPGPVGLIGVRRQPVELTL